MHKTTVKSWYYKKFFVMLAGLIVFFLASPSLISAQAQKPRSWLFQEGNKVYDPPLYFGPPEIVQETAPEIEQKKPEQEKPADTVATTETVLAEEPQEQPAQVLPVLPPQKPAEHFKLTGAQIEKMQCASTTDILPAIGVQIKQAAHQNSIQVRGFSNSSIAVIIDGILVNSPMNGEFDFTSINPKDIDSIEYCSSSKELLHNFPGGTIIIRTKKSSPGWSWGFDTNVKTLFIIPVDATTNSIFFDISKGIFALKTTTGFSHSKNIFSFSHVDFSKPQIKDGGTLNSGYSNISLAIKPFEKLDLVVSNRFSYIGRTVTGTYTQKNQDLLKDWSNSSQVSMSFAPSQSLSLTSTINHSFLKETYTSPSENSTHYVNSTSALLQLFWTNQSFYSQNASISVEHDNIQSTDLAAKNLTTATLMVSPDFKIDSVWNIAIPIGLIIRNTTIEAVPSILTSVTFDTVDFSLFCGRIVRLPTMNQLYWKDTAFAAGNPNLQPENGWRAEFSAALKNTILPLKTTLHSTLYTQKIIWESSPSLQWTPNNVGKAFFTGVSLHLDQQLNEYIGISAAYDFVLSFLLTDGLTLRDNRRIMYTPEHSINTTFRFDYRFFHAAINANYIGERYISNLNIAKLSDVLKVSLLTTFDLHNTTQLYAKLDNIFNDTSAYTDSYPTQGISLTLGLKSKFKGKTE